MTLIFFKEKGWSLDTSYLLVCIVYGIVFLVFVANFIVYMVKTKKWNILLRDLNVANLPPFIFLYIIYIPCKIIFNFYFINFFLKTVSIHFLIQFKKISDTPKNDQENKKIQYLRVGLFFNIII